MARIRVLKADDVDGRPIEFNDVLVGLILPVMSLDDVPEWKHRTKDRPITLLSDRSTWEIHEDSPKWRRPSQGYYLVRFEDFVTALEEVNPAAADWWRNNNKFELMDAIFKSSDSCNVDSLFREHSYPVNMIAFDVEDCELIQDEVLTESGGE